ncbi:response regulator transcription factor [Clostridium sp. D53t1_180928_C8]|uniref:response regulator transcription factor n=1 Tax=Clostridium sp. D53t1_180928_C8 TaxID=2787101 RepID=UPI0018A8DB18|nr:response regulator transcription factor [Clostridium sp. D53t1_180928_C8]
MKNKIVLVVEDEEKINKMVCDYFKFNDFSVISASDGMEAVEKFNYHIDLVILDVMLPKLDGFTVLRRIRKKSNVPVIMLTARSDDEDILMGYELKVDDYVTKPFNLEILVAKSKVLLNRIDLIESTKSNIKENILDYNGIKIDKLKMESYIDGEIIELEPKQFDILEYLMENKNIVISREKLLEAKWGYDYFGNTRVVDAQIKKLRKSLKHKSYCIKTVFGVGYKFEVD